MPGEPGSSQSSDCLPYSPAEERARSLQDSDFLDVVALSLDGSEEGARSVSDAAFQRPNPANTDLSSDEKQAKVFTLYLWPEEYVAKPRAEDLVAIHLPWAKPALLAKAAQREVDDIYATHGTDGAYRLYGSAGLSDKEHRAVDWTSSQPNEGIFPNAVPFESWGEASNAGEFVVRALDSAIGALLRTRVPKILKQVEQCARSIGIARLDDARAEIESEAERYLDLDRPGALSASEILGTAEESLVELRGPGVPGLLGAFQKIDRRLAALEAAAQDYAAKEREVKENRYGYVAQTGGPQTAPSVFSDVTPEEMRREFPSTATSLEEASQALALVVLVQGRSFPVLCRIWKDHRLPSTIEVRWTSSGPTLSGKDNAALSAIDRLRLGIWTALTRAYYSNKSLADELRSTPSAVWRYPPLINAALESLSYIDPSVEFRAAQERVASEEGIPLLKILGAANGAVAVTAAIVGAAPPIGFALACTALVIGAATTVEDLLKEQEKDRAFMAALDPSKALASEPDYSGFLVGVAFTLLDLKGVRDAARLVSEAGAIQAVLEAET